MIKLIGRLSFAAWAIWGGQARSRLRGLYTWSLSGLSRLSSRARSELQWWSQRLSAAPPVYVQPRVFAQDPLIVYTDAEGSSGFGLLVVDGSDRWWSKGSFSPMVTASLAVRRTQIFAYEVMAVWIAVTMMAARLSGRVVLFFVDNQSALHSIAKGSTAACDVQLVVQHLWDLLSHHHCWPHWKWVPSKLNLSDAPSRGRPAIVGREVKCRIRQEAIVNLLRSAS